MRKEQIEIPLPGKVNQFPYPINTSTTKKDVEAMTDFEELSLMIVARSSDKK